MAVVSLAALISTLASTPSQPIEKIYVFSNRHHFERLGQKSAQTDIINVESQSISPRTFADLIKYTPGITLNGQGGLFQSYSIRGFSKSRIRTEIEGVPILTDRRAGNSLSFVDPEFIESINIKKGPVSALYGSDAMGGVVSSSLKSHNQSSFNVQTQPSDEQISLSLLYSNDFTSSGLSYRKANNSKAPNDQILHTEYEQFSSYIKTEQYFNELLATASVLVSHTNDVGKSSALYPTERVTLYPSDLHSVVFASLSNESSWYANIFHHYQNWDSDVLRPEKRLNTTSYQSHTLGGLYYIYVPYISENDKIGIDLVSRRGVKIDEVEKDLDSNLNSKTDVLLGSQENFAVFMESTWHLDNVTTLSTGFRFDKFYQQNDLLKQSKHDDALNGSIALNFSANENWTLSAELGTGFRMPTLSELYFNGETPRGSTLGNPNLEPEKNIGLALSSKWQISNLEIQANIYHQSIDNYIERYRISDELRSYRNLEQGDIQGFEMYLSYKQTKDFTHSLSYQWQSGEDQEQKILADLNTPEITYQTAISSQQFSIKNMLRYRFEKNEVADGEKPLAAVIVWDLKTHWYVNESLTLTLSGLNLLDKEYTASADEDAALQAERRASVGLNFRF